MLLILATASAAINPRSAGVAISRLLELLVYASSLPSLHARCKGGHCAVPVLSYVDLMRQSYGIETTRVAVCLGPVFTSLYGKIFARIR